MVEPYFRTIFSVLLELVQRNIYIHIYTVYVYIYIHIAENPNLVVIWAKSMVVGWDFPLNRSNCTKKTQQCLIHHSNLRWYESSGILRQDRLRVSWRTSKWLKPQTWTRKAIETGTVVGKREYFSAATVWKNGIEPAIPHGYVGRVSWCKSWTPR